MTVRVPSVHIEVVDGVLVEDLALLARQDVGEAGRVGQAEDAPSDGGC